MEWINVNDKLPKEYELVLCSTDRTVFIGYRKDSGVWTNGKKDNIPVNHWTPIPERHMEGFKNGKRI